MRHPAKRRAVRRRRRAKHQCLLEDRAVTPKTRARYYTAVQRLLRGISQPQDLDEAVCQWIQQQYEDGESITTISDALCGLQHYSAGLEGSLGHSWRLFKIWRRVEKPRQAPPLPLSFLQGMIGRCLELEKLEFATCLAIGFWGMLRTGELLQLSTQQILLGADDLVIRLGLTKTGLRQAVDENVLVTDQPTWLLCSTLLTIRKSQRHPDNLLWPRGAPAFREEFKQLIQFFRLQTSFKPYSLRRGGATHDFRSHGLMEHTLLRGRWSTTSAARQYVQEGLSALTEIKISKQSHQLLKAYQTLFQ